MRRLLTPSASFAHVPLLVLVLSCSSESETPSDSPPAGGADGTVAENNPAGGTAAGGTAADGAAPGGTARNDTAAGGMVQNGAATGGTAGGDTEEDDGEPVGDASFETACVAAAGGDGLCAAYVCQSCERPLDDCGNTAGCPEILQCVSDSGCIGLDCFCGDTPLPACVAGQGSGPCRDAILSAPGGRVPDLVNPSGGPASDAALAVGQCADGACPGVCEVEI
jgi:hypothetical protein